jgi:hypothetical protein
MAQTMAVRQVETDNKWKRVFRTPFPGLLSSQAADAIGKMTDGKGNNRIADLLKDSDVGGSLSGSASGRGVPGQSLNDYLGRSSQNQQQTQNLGPSNNWGAQPGEKPIFNGNQIVGYTTDGKTFSRKVGQPAPQPAQSSFTTPNGTTMSLGQMIQASGRTGTVMGQHPDTGKAIVHWHDQGQ